MAGSAAGIDFSTATAITLSAKKSEFSLPRIDVGAVDKENAEYLANDVLNEEERLVALGREGGGSSGSMLSNYSLGISLGFNAISRVVDHTAISPRVSDIIGIIGTAKALLSHWARTLSPEQLSELQHEIINKKWRESQIESSDRSLRYMTECLNRLDELPHLNEIQHISPEAAAASHYEKSRLYNSASRVAAIAAGRVAAVVALHDAARGGFPRDVICELGQTSSKSAREHLFSLGFAQPDDVDESGRTLEEHDYSLILTDEGCSATIHPQAIDRLFTPVNIELEERIDTSISLRNGEEDEPGWHPAGMMKLVATRLDSDPLIMCSPDYVFDPDWLDTIPEIEQKMIHFIGSAMYHGWDPLHCYAYLVDADRIDALLSNAPQDRRKEYLDHYQKALYSVAPYDVAFATVIEDERKKLINKVNDRLGEYADDDIKSRVSSGEIDEKQAELASQRVSQRGYVQDALRKAQESDGRLRAAFVCELTELDKVQIRSWSYTHIFDIPTDSDLESLHLSDDQMEAFRFWNDLVTDGDPYVEIQKAMAGAAASSDKEPMLGVLANINLADGTDCLQFARRYPDWCGFKSAKGPRGLDRVLALEEDRYMAAPDGVVEIPNTLTYPTVVRRSRTSLQRAMRKWALTNLAGCKKLAESGFDPQIPCVSQRWAKYASVVTDPYSTIQGFMQGEVIEKFAEAMQRAGYEIKIDDATVVNAHQHQKALVSSLFSEPAVHSKEVEEDYETALSDINTLRKTAGHSVDASLALLSPYIGHGHRNGIQTMTGDRIEEQRAVNLLLALKKIGIASTSANTRANVAIGAFSHLLSNRANTDVHRGLFIVPGSSLLMYGEQVNRKSDHFRTSMGFVCHAKATPEDRRKTYSMPAVHLHIVSASDFRDDICYLVGRQLKMADQNGNIDTEDVLHQLVMMSDNEKAKIVQKVVKAANWVFDFVYYEHSEKTDIHSDTIAAMFGKEIDYMLSSTDKTICDSEATLLTLGRVVDPNVFGDNHPNPLDSEDTISAVFEIRRKFNAYCCSVEATTSLGRATSSRTRSIHLLEMTAPQKAKYSPDSSDAYMIANKLKKGAKMIWLTEHDHGYAAKNNEPIVVFVRSISVAIAIYNKLVKNGFRAMCLNSGLSAEELVRYVKLFEGGLGQILVTTDAAAVGQDLRRGKHVINWDAPVPDRLAQRISHIGRMSEEKPVMVHDLVLDCPTDIQEWRAMVERNVSKIF